jgi:uncharacterized membrane protein
VHQIRLSLFLLSPNSTAAAPALPAVHLLQKHSQSWQATDIMSISESEQDVRHNLHEL